MNRYITKIRVNKLFHLGGFEIPVADDAFPHLIITGRNGSGKTVLLNAVADFLDKIKDDKRMLFLSYESQLDYYAKKEQTAKEPDDKMSAQTSKETYMHRIDELYGKVCLEFNDVADIISSYNKNNLIIAFYQADRKSNMVEPKNPTKPVYSTTGGIKKTATNQFLNFLSDLKIQEALARNEGQDKDADGIAGWFEDFEKLLSRIYQDENLKLEFNYKDYSFRICTEGKRFKFTEMSDGFAAVLDIVADLILKMQSGDSPVRAYEKRGIVLIDEVETHLHLGLQKIVMPLLTQVFPNVQFVITTHSPFVLSSMDNAVAFDLEHREVIGDLTDYSYDSLAEGYFGVRTESDYAQMQMDMLEGLLRKDVLSDSERVAVRQLMADFEKVPESASPMLVGQFRQMKMRFADRVKDVLGL